MNMPRLFALIAIVLIPGAAKAQISLAWPVACKVGETCEIQHYVDHGQGTAAQNRRAIFLAFRSLFMMASAEAERSGASSR